MLILPNTVNAFPGKSLFVGVCVCVSVYVCACAHFDLCIGTVGMLAIPKLFDPVVCYDMFNVVIRNFPVVLGFPKKASIKEKCQKGTPPNKLQSQLASEEECRVKIERRLTWHENVRDHISSMSRLALEEAAPQLPAWLVLESQSIP